MRGALVIKNRISAAVLCCAFLICVLSLDCAAQNQRRGGRKDVLPRVGTIEDYEATGLMVGCANMYFYQAFQAKPLIPKYVFIARGDGSDAWMNLGGLDVRLQQIRSLTRANRKVQRYFYRLGNLRVSVTIERFKPENAPADDDMFKMKITLRRAGAVRIVRAVGDADC